MDGIKVEIGNFANGKRTGKWQITEPKKNKVSVGYYENDTKNGLWKTHQGGYLKASGTYENDLKQGTWQCFI